MTAADSWLFGRQGRGRPARAGHEAGLEEERHQLGLPHRFAVEALDRQALAPLGLHVLDESRERGPQPFFVRFPQGDDRAAAPLDEERRLAAQEDDLCAWRPALPGHRPAWATAAPRRTAEPGRRRR